MSSRGARQTVDRDTRRQSLVDAARELFTKRGYHATTVDDITRAAGVAKGTFYLYFSEKREAYHEVIRGFMDLIKAIGGEIGDNPATPAEFFERAEAAGHQLMAVFLDNYELARLAYRESMGLDGALESMLSRFYRELAEVEAHNIRTAQQLGIVRHDIDPLLVGYAHIGAVERVLLAYVEAPDDFPAPEAVVRQILQVTFEGLRRR